MTEGDAQPSRPKRSAGRFDVPTRRPSIPEVVKRELRQEAGFGCCICGLPIYEYHHIVRWAEHQAHDPTNLMLLCPLHHDQATKGALEEEEQREHKRCPHNISRGYVDGLLKINQRYCAVEAGGVLMVGDGTTIAADDEALVDLRLGTDGRLLLSLRLYDADDALVAEVVENEWLAGDVLTWDMEASWQRLKIRLGARKIALRLNATGEPVALQADLWRRGHNIRLTARGMEFMNGAGIEGGGLVNGGIHIDTASGQVSIRPRPGEHMMLVTGEPDRLSRLARCIEVYDRMKRDDRAVSAIWRPTA